MYEINAKFQSYVRHYFYNFCTMEECVYSWLLDRCVLHLDSLVMLEKDDVFKLSIYLNIYLFSCVGILPVRSVEASLLRTLNL